VGIADTFQVRVTWSGTAVRGVDYNVSVSGGSLSADGRTLTFSAGSSTVTLRITPLVDTAAEGAESVVLAVDPQAHYAVGTSSATAAIQDNTALPTLSVLDTAVAEGDRRGWATVTITLSAPSTSSVTVTVRTYDSTAKAGSDYDGYVGSVTFAAGQTTATVQIRILGDRLREGDETFTLELSGPVGAVIADGVGMVTIYDDDGARLLATTMGANGPVGNLSDAELSVVLDAAIAAWIAAGADPAALSGITVELATLDGVILAEESGGHLRIDVDAAGWGWHLDPGSAVPADRVDLLSVLLHEIGHVLGFDHHTTGLMVGTIESGTRFLVEPLTAASDQTLGRTAPAAHADTAATSASEVFAASAVAAQRALSARGAGLDMLSPVDSAAGLIGTTMRTTAAGVATLADVSEHEQPLVAWVTLLAATVLVIGSVTDGAIRRRRRIRSAR
jgi:hypothetical protein